MKILYLERDLSNSIIEVHKYSKKGEKYPQEGQERTQDYLGVHMTPKEKGIVRICSDTERKSDQTC